MIQTILAQSGMTLFGIAATYLEDATLWSRIALINNIRDPFLAQPTMLMIPPSQAGQRLRNGTQ
jgi:hypothetical protein